MIIAVAVSEKADAPKLGSRIEGSSLLVGTPHGAALIRR